MQMIVVVGVGALGSQAVLSMRQLPTHMTVVDFDRVEAKNVQSQFHTKPAIGQFKVRSLASLMYTLFGMKLDSIPHKLGPHNVDAILGGADLVVDCMDNAASRQLVQIYVRSAQLPCLHAAVDANGSFGRITWDEHFTIDQEDAEGAPTCENGEHLPFLGIVAAHLAQAVKEFVSSGRRIGYQVSPSGTFVV